MIRLKLDRRFQPCPEEVGDKLFANGIFVFNITRLLAFIQPHTTQFPMEHIALVELPDYGHTRLDEETILNADLSRPILRAEISPGLYNVIDGRHRLARARRERLPSIPARRVDCPRHLPFLTSALAYERYVDCWNSKVEA